MNNHRTMTIKGLIKQLRLIEKELNEKGHKNVKVMLSCDSEGNAFGTVAPESFSFQEDHLVIYPYDECCEM